MKKFQCIELYSMQNTIEHRSCGNKQKRVSFKRAYNSLYSKRHLFLINLTLSLSCFKCRHHRTNTIGYKPTFSSPRKTRKQSPAAYPLHTHQAYIDLMTYYKKQNQKILFATIFQKLHMSSSQFHTRPTRNVQLIKVLE